MSIPTPLSARTPLSAGTPLSARTPLSAGTTTSIDLCNPAQTCHQLGLTEAGLIDVVNRGELAAYRIGDNIRFRQVDVLARKTALAAAC